MDGPGISVTIVQGNGTLDKTRPPDPAAATPRIPTTSLPRYICRVCGEENSDMIQLYPKTSSQKQLRMFLKKYFKIQVLINFCGIKF